MRQSFADWISQLARTQQRTKVSPTPPRAADGELERYQERVKQLLSIANQQADDLAKEREKRLRAEQKLESVRSELKESEKDRRSLKRTLRRAGRELNSLKHSEELPAIASLRQQLDQIQNQVDEAFVKEENLRVRAETRLKAQEKEVIALKQTLAAGTPSRKSLINARIEEERDLRRTAEKESKNLKRKLRHTSRSLNTLRRDHSKCRGQSNKASSNGSATSDDLIGAVLPNLQLVRDSHARLARARDTKQVFDGMMRINDTPQLMRGERVGSAEPWLEIRPTLTDRIYYRQAKGRGRYVVLIGDKNSQARDIEWMRRNN